MAKDYWDPKTSAEFKDFWIDPYSGLTSDAFDAVEPAYSFGWNSALAAEYPHETWDDAEGDLEQQWNASHQHHGPWSEMKEHVREAWTKARADWKGLASKAKSKSS